MELRSSFTYPGVKVSKCGKLFFQGQELTKHVNHSLSTRGPIVYLTLERARQISVASQVFECWHLESKYSRNIFLEFIDGNTSNCHADNLRRVSRSDLRPRDYYDGEYSGGWLNGNDGIYL